MKCLEKLLLKTILPFVKPHLYPLQFAYREKRGTEDAVACLLHLVLQHLDSPGNFARILFVLATNRIKIVLRLQHHPKRPAHPEASSPQHSTHPDPPPAQLPQ
jgi:hypothetical protein